MLNALFDKTDFFVGAVGARGDRVDFQFHEMH